LIRPRPLGRLMLAAASAAGRSGHISAASGLVRVGERLYVVADDEPAMAVYDLERERLVGELVPLDQSELPLGHDERKAAKPDLESLCLLPDEVLFTLGSGATERRERGWLLPVRGGEPSEVSLGDLYTSLRRELADLNIEGAAVTRGRLWLAQRGNGRDGENALIELDLDDALTSLREHRAIDPGAVRDISRHDLGDVEGVPLTFSDLCPLPDGLLLFCAVAEAGESTYLDGECVGAALGLLDAGGVKRLERLAEPHKVEGVSVAAGLDLLLVADGDDPATAAPLLAASLAL
jgi:hypothetical protein